MKISVTIRIQIHIIYMYQKDRTYSKGDLRNTVIFKKKKKELGLAVLTWGTGLPSGLWCPHWTIGCLLPRSRGSRVISASIKDHPMSHKPCFLLPILLRKFKQQKKNSLISYHLPLSPDAPVCYSN